MHRATKYDMFHGFHPYFAPPDLAVVGGAAAIFIFLRQRVVICLYLCYIVTVT